MATYANTNLKMNDNFIDFNSNWSQNISKLSPRSTFFNNRNEHLSPTSVTDRDVASKFCNLRIPTQPNGPKIGVKSGKSWKQAVFESYIEL